MQVSMLLGLITGLIAFTYTAILSQKILAPWFNFVMEKLPEWLIDPLACDECTAGQLALFAYPLYTGIADPIYYLSFYAVWCAASLITFKEVGRKLFFALFATYPLNYLLFKTNTLFVDMTHHVFAICVSMLTAIILNHVNAKRVPSDG